MSNQAAWLDGKGQKLRVAESDLPKPGPDEIVVKNHTIAINPVDWKIQDYGLFVKQWPFIAGTDVAGEVYQVGSEVKNFKPGDRVLSHVVSIDSQKNEDGGFQLYTRVKNGHTAIIPDNISYSDAAVLPLAIDTAAHGLYGKRENGLLGLDYPTLDPKPSGKTILIWGGSSSVGAVATQLAVASGAKVVAVASKHNHDFVKKLGASAVIDYSGSSVVDDIVEAIKSVGGDFQGIYDAISNDKSYQFVFPIAEKLGGTNVAITLPPPKDLPQGTKLGKVYSVTPDVVSPLWKFVTEALKTGVLKALPEPLVVGKGLESVQKGLDTNRAGVSAKKVIVELI